MRMISILIYISVDGRGPADIVCYRSIDTTAELQGAEHVYEILKATMWGAWEKREVDINFWTEERGAILPWNVVGGMFLSFQITDAN